MSLVLAHLGSETPVIAVTVDHVIVDPPPDLMHCAVLTHILPPLMAIRLRRQAYATLLLWTW